MAISGMFAIRNFASDEESYLMYAAIHYVDLIRFLFGEVNELAGYKLNPGGDVNYIFSFVTDKGYIGNMYFGGVSSWGRHYEEITITGTKGYVKVENKEKAQCHYSTEATFSGPAWQALDEKSHHFSSVLSTSSGGWQNLYLLGYVGEVEHFLTCVANGISPTPSASDNVKTVKLCGQLLRSLKDVG